ncbi:MAG: SUMF1/EgtB/PvdO family nonheme iron enzyme [Myxococcales bacterium]|nr:SUMF1/EgtB/PvdO family nonheme iron enzyme [Myxococcales bacterium]
MPPAWHREPGPRARRLCRLAAGLRGVHPYGAPRGGRGVAGRGPGAARRCVMKPHDTLTALASMPADMARARAVWALFTEAEPQALIGPLLATAVDAGLLDALAAERLKLQHAARGGPRLWVEPRSGIEMIWIGGGPARLGPTGESVEMAGFSLARHPVTRAVFGAFVDATGGETSAEPEGLAAHPKVEVSQAEAHAFCVFAGLNLPTEWMWEKAARGPDGRMYPWGSDWPRRELAQIQAKETCAIATRPKVRTAYGCQDMIGNVSERCLPGDEADRGALPLLRAAPPPDETTLVPVRGSAFLRFDASRDRFACWHRRQLSAGRRNHWCGFRPAFSWLLDAG